MWKLATRMVYSRKADCQGCKKIIENIINISHKIEMMHIKRPVGRNRYPDYKKKEFPGPHVVNFIVASQ